MRFTSHFGFIVQIPPAILYTKDIQKKGLTYQGMNNIILFVYETNIDIKRQICGVCKSSLEFSGKFDEEGEVTSIA